MPIDYGTNNVTSSGNVNISGVITATSGVFGNLTVGGSSFNSAVTGLLPTISNSGDNRILTSTGSSVGINAESNLTFSDGVLTIGGTGNAIPSQIHLYNNDSLDSVIRLTLYDTSANAMLSIESNDDVDSNDILSYYYPLNIISFSDNLYLGGPSSNYIQIDLNSNINIVANSGVRISNSNLRINNQTANTIASFDSNKDVVSLSTSTYPSLTELSYVKGTTSTLQTQINAKQNTLTNPVTGTGISNHIAYWNSSSGIVADSGQLYWDATNNRLGIGTASPAESLEVSGTIRISDSAGRLQLFRGGGTAYDYTIGKEGNNTAISTSNDGSTFRYTQFGYHAGSTWTPKTVVNNYNGKIGVANLTPTYELDVTGSGHFTQNLLVDGDCTIGALKAFKFNGNAWGYDRIVFRSDVNNKITSDSSGNYNWLVASRNWTLSDVGNVGIGTSSPSQKISINGNAIIGTEGSTRIGITGAGGSTSIAEYYLTEANPRWLIGRDTGGAGVAALGFSTSSTLAAGGAAVGHPATRALGLYTSNGTALTERVRISASGDVGIGTTAPSGRLNVIGTGLFSTVTGIAPNALLDLYSATTGDMIFNAEGTNGSLFSIVDNLSGTLMSVNNSAGLPVFEVFSDDKVVAGRFGQNDFVVSSGGNVGIGTASPSYKLDVNGSGNFITILEGGNRVKNKTLTYFTPLNNNPPASGFATLDTRNSIAVLDFDDTTAESGMFVGIIPENAALSSGILARIHWMATSATSGTCRWGVQFEKMTSDLDTDSFDATVAESGSVTNATNGVPTITEISCTGIDSLTSGDLFRILIYRDVSDAADTMVGDAELIAIELRSII